MGDRGQAAVDPALPVYAIIGGITVYLAVRVAEVGPRWFWATDACPQADVVCSTFPLAPIFGAVAGVCVLGLGRWAYQWLREGDSA